MAIINLFSAGKPPFAFPHITLAHGSFNDSDPPVEADNNHKTDHPLKKDPYPIEPTE